MDDFEAYFKAVNNPDDQFFMPDDDVLYFLERFENNEFNIMFEELNIPITQDEIDKSIKQLSSNKSGGPDNYLNEFFIHGKVIFLPYLTKLFNKIFDLGYFPDSWSEGCIIPLHKKGSINEVNNYRGITLLSTLGKLFTRVLNNRLCKWAETNGVYIEAQAGFRGNMGTNDNIFALHGIINHMINNNKQLYCAFIDFSKAFDYVSRDNLWMKLIKLGIRGKMLTLIKSMYDGVKSRVKYQNELSNVFDCHLGVRQGECLSPFLFAMFVNDIESHFMDKGSEGVDIYTFKLFLILYADDIVIFAKSSKELQEHLDFLSDYCSKWRLMVNTNKTKIMIFRKGGSIPYNVSFHYEGSQLDIVNKFVYLGLVFTSGGSHLEAQNTLAGQSLKAIFKLNKYLYKFTNIGIKHKLELFDKLITPILNYNSETWGFHPGHAVEKVHLQFCKRLLCVKKSTQNDFVYGEVGRMPLQNMRLYNIIKFWIKILHSEPKKYIYIVYNALYQDQLNKPQIKNWCSSLKQLLLTLGFGEAWYYQSVGNKNIFLTLAKQRIRDQFLQNWNSRLHDSSRAIFYRNIVTFMFQPYLDIINIAKNRINLTRIRVSSHRLHIETGRWKKPIATPINERKCSICDKLEDEFHFVLECKMYESIRKELIPAYYYLNPNMFKFTELIMTNNTKMIRKLSLYLTRSMELRNNCPYQENQIQF